MGLSGLCNNGSEVPGIQPRWAIRPPPLTIYCARPISGCDYQLVVDYYHRIGSRLSLAGFRVLTPMCGKEYLRTDPKLKAHGHGAPVSTNHAVKERDKWMVQTSNLVFVNLIDTDRVSIGSVMELAWADAFGAHSIVALSAENIHRHAFVLDCADIVFPGEEEALLYLEKLASGSLD